MNIDKVEETKMISIQKIDAIFEEKTQHSVKLEEEFKFHSSRLAETKQQINQDEEKIEKLIEMNKIIEQDIEWKSHLREELLKYRLSATFLDW